MADISQINLPTSGGSTTYDINAKKVNGHTVGIDVPANAVFTDTKNTAGSTDTSSKIFLVGATSQANNPQTYSDNEVYVTSGTLTSAKSDTKAIVARTGSGTAGSTSGTTQTPALWTFNSGITVANGEIYFIKIPVAGGTYGVWLSLNNGTNYYPVAVSSGKSRFTTHYAKNTVIAVTYESGGKCTCYPKAGGDTTSDVTGIFRVLNDYDANTTYSAISASELTTGTATTLRTVRADYLKSGVNDLIDAKVWTGTQEQYDDITTPDPSVTYFITDGVVNPVPATNISYNNTSSGLTANTVQSAIDEVNSSTQWIGVATKTGSTAITLPSTWTELFILCQYGNSSAVQAQCVQTNIIRPAVDTTRVFTFGGATIFAQVQFASATSVSMIYFGVSGTAYTSTSQIRVWAKTA